MAPRPGVAGLKESCSEVKGICLRVKESNPWNEGNRVREEASEGIK
ncbi:hypothetical protein [Jeotgalibacillus aurantiacus]|nr:hypothetical protein [Jeotgalibacillus aurantiacus]